MKYIDVSEWQGVIDWEKVRPNIDGAILRAGYGLNHIDAQFVRNASECNRLGISIGAYWFSYALNTEMAKQEAQYLVSAVRPYRMELPLCFDFEYDSVTTAAKNGVTVTKSLATEMTYAFCEAIEEAGYYAMFYANPDYLNRYFAATLPKRFALWLAEWGPGQPSRNCAVWQYSSKGSIVGIKGDVDMDKSYTDFAEVIIEAGLNHLGPKSGAEAALEWAKAQDLCRNDAATVNDLPTWGELALALREYQEVIK